MSKLNEDDKYILDTIYKEEAMNIVSKMKLTGTDKIIAEEVIMKNLIWENYCNMED